MNHLTAQSPVSGEASLEVYLLGMVDFEAGLFLQEQLVAEISQVPKVPVDVDAETGKKLVRLMEALDDQDDVQNVYSSANLSEEMVAHGSEG